MENRSGHRIGNKCTYWYHYIQDANNPSMDVLTLEHEYAYSVSVVNNVFYVNSVPQAQISFVKNQTYKFFKRQ